LQTLRLCLQGRGVQLKTSGAKARWFQAGFSQGLSPDPRNREVLKQVLAGFNAVRGNLHFTDPAKREEEPDKVFGRIFGSLPHDGPDGIGNGGVKRDVFHLHPRQIHANVLATLEHIAIVFAPAR
jgi:hypothetical protein